MTSSRNDREGKPTSEDPSLAVKAAWYGSELLGNIVGALKPKTTEVVDTECKGTTPLGREEAVASLRTDYDRVYFVTGEMDMNLYEDDCEFADPFVAFRGLQRFKNNLDNLGSFMDDVNLDVTGWEETEVSLKTQWRFRCVLGLPWRPSLAASGGTEHIFSPETGRIVRHVESWNIKPMDALKQLVRPGRSRKE
ncbi:unnamed protein product [Discosporangium mesarthrocarpum]